MKQRGGMKIIKNINIIKGDITEIEADAIVNAANTTLLGGGGVDGAIHKKAGPELLEECRQLHGCKTGEAKITKGYNLKSKYVIHTVGPIYARNTVKISKKLLQESYYNSMNLAKKYGINSIAFPAISTGVYGYPKQDAAEIALDTVINYCENNSFFPNVIFVLFDKENYSIYSHRLNNGKEDKRQDNDRLPR